MNKAQGGVTVEMNKGDVMRKAEEEVTVLQKTDRHIMVEWKIKNFFDLFYDAISSNFSFLDENWCFQMYPNGDEGYFSEGCISLYLNRCAIVPLDEPRYTCTIGIKKADGSVFESFSGDFTWVKNNGWGVSNFLRRFKLLQRKDVITQRGNLIVFATIYVKNGPDKEKPLLTESLGTLSQNFKDLYFSGCHSDIKIKVKDREFQAHKCVLTVRSPVFASMFKHDMAESSSGVVNVCDCDPESFVAFLLFLYSGEVDNISPTNAVSVYKMADKYDIKELKKACCQCLRSNIQVDTVCDAIHLGAVHGESDLLEIATDFFIENSNSILTSPMWKEFITENPLLANELFIKTINNLKI